MRAGYLGPQGSHTHLALEQFFTFYGQEGDETPFVVPMMTLTQLLESVEEEALDIACVPVENALEGSVGEVLDVLVHRLEKTRVVAEFVRPIQHCLIRRYNTTEGIAFIHSHPQAYAQCRAALAERLGSQLQFVPTASTSEAVKALVGLDETHAALGTQRAAQQYDLEVVVDNMNDSAHNQTRFILVSAHADPLAQVSFGAASQKTSLCVALHHNKPGALLDYLTLLANLGLNMSKIESRPTKTGLGEYLFFVDIEGACDQAVLQQLAADVPYFRLLGVYPMLGVMTQQ